MSTDWPPASDGAAAALPGVVPNAFPYICPMSCACWPMESIESLFPTYAFSSFEIPFSGLT